MANYSINAVPRRLVATGSVGLGPYIFTFEILVQTDIQVYLNETLLTLTSDYTVTINENGTGQVNLVLGTNIATTPTVSDIITIIGARDIERTTDFVTAGDLIASSLNEQLDSLVIFDQQISERVDRALIGSISDSPNLDMTLPSVNDRKGKYLAFNSSTGAPEAGPDTADAATLAAITADITTLAHIEDGTDATDSIQTVAGIASDVTGVFNISADVTAVAGVATTITDNLSAIQNAATNAATATTKASEAATSASAAAASATSAQTAQAATELVFDNFDDKFLGTKSSDPTTDNDGDPLVEGAMYYNSASDVIKFYNGSSWESPSVSATNSATAAATSATNAATSATNAANSASNASTSESNAATSETNASNSATNAATSETNASTSATNAATSATSAATSATSAATSATNAAASYDDFDDRYLGAKASAPTTDNDGDALITGALYFNTTQSTLFLWNGSSWDQATFNINNLVSETSATGSAEIPAGTTAQRDVSPDAGYLRFNTTDSSFEGYDGSAWGAIGGGSGGASGGGSDAIFYENGQTITTSYSITANTNAMSTGPLTVNSGVSVTVPSGSRWVVL